MSAKGCLINIDTFLLVVKFFLFRPEDQLTSCTSFDSICDGVVFQNSCGHYAHVGDFSLSFYCFINIFFRGQGHLVKPIILLVFLLGGKYFGMRIARWTKIDCLVAKTR